MKVAGEKSLEARKAALYFAVIWLAVASIVLGKTSHNPLWFVLALLFIAAFICAYCAYIVERRRHA